MRSRAELHPAKETYPKPGNKAGEPHVLSMSYGNLVSQPTQDYVILLENIPGFDFTLSYWVKAQTLGSFVDFCPQKR